MARSEIQVRHGNSFIHKNSQGGIGRLRISTIAITNDVFEGYVLLFSTTKYKALLIILFILVKLDNLTITLACVSVKLKSVHHFRKLFFFLLS